VNALAGLVALVVATAAAAFFWLGFTTGKAGGVPMLAERRTQPVTFWLTQAVFAIVCLVSILRGLVALGL
jgi:hypothetical protein